MNSYLLAEGKGKTWFLSSFSEVDALQGHATEIDVVCGDEALHGTGTVLDGKLGAIRFV